MTIFVIDQYPPIKYRPGLLDGPTEMPAATMAVRSLERRRPDGVDRFELRTIAHETWAPQEALNSLVRRASSLPSVRPPLQKLPVPPLA